jgi:hypothetical protein
MLNRARRRPLSRILTASKVATGKRVLLLSLVMVAALAGMFSPVSSVVVHSSDTLPTVAPNQGQTAVNSVDVGGSSKVGVLKSSLGSLLRPSMTLARTRVSNAGTAKGDERAVLNHAPVVRRVFPSFLLVGPVIEAAKADALVNDDGDGKIDPNNGTGTAEKITYTVTLKNTGDTDATNVIYSDTIDTHTTLVPGSINTTPIAVDDSFTASGNIRITYPSGSLTGNDFDPDTGTNTGLTAVAVTKKSTNMPTALADNVTINANGSFIYDPPPGFEGDDTFTYTTQSPDGSTGTGTVTITVSGMIWFINNNAGAAGSAPGDGRLSNPFKLLATFQAVNDGVDNTGTHVFHPAANDNIFIYESATSYIGPVSLLSGQKLIGQDSSASLSSLTGINPPSGSDSLPTTVPGGTLVTITNGAGNGVNLGSGNLLRGFNISGTSAIGLNGSGFGTLSLTEVNVSSNGQALSLANGTLSGPTASTATFGTVSSGGGTDGILLNTIVGTMTATGGTLTGTASGPTFSVIGGTVSVTYNGNITQASNNAAVMVSGGHATGTLTFQTGTISATSGTGLQFSNADGTYVFSGTTTMNGGDAGIDIITGSDGSFNFGTLTSITNPSGDAFLINGGNGPVTYQGTIAKNNAGRAVNIQSRTGNSVSLSGSISSTASSSGILAQSNSGGTINFSNASKVINVTGASNAVTLTSNNGATINFTNGLDIDTVDGIGFSASGGGIINVSSGTNTVASTSGQAIDIDAVQTNITFNSVDSTASPAQGIDLTNLSNSSIFTVSGTTNITNASSGSTSININNVGASSDINFGTTNIINRNNTGIQITSAAGTVDFGSTTIANLNNAGGHGIRVDTSSAVITITTASISNTQQNSAEADANADGIAETDGDGDAIFLKDNTSGTFRFNLNGGTLQDLDDDGVDVRNSGGVNLTGVTIQRPNRVGNSTQPGHHGFYAIELRGTNNKLQTCTIQEVPSGGGGVRVTNVTQSGALLTLDDCTFTQPNALATKTGDSFVVFQGGGTTNNSITITNTCDFFNLNGEAVQTQAGVTTGSTATVNTTIQNSTFRNAATGGPVPGNNGVIINSSQAGTANFTVTGNSFTDVERDLAGTSGTLHIQGNGGNLVGTAGGAGALKNTFNGATTTSAGFGRRAIHIVSEPLPGQSGSINITLNNNEIDQYLDHEAIFAAIRTTTGDSELSIINNRIGQLAGAVGQVGGSREAIEIRAQRPGAGESDVVHTFKVDISNNTVSANSSGDEVIDVDSEGRTSLPLTFLNNTLNNTNGAGSRPLAEISTEDTTASICLDIRNNNATHANGGQVEYSLLNTLGTYQVEGAGLGAVSAANIQAQNTAGQASVSGAITFNNNANCAEPVAMLDKLQQIQQEQELAVRFNNLQQLMDDTTASLQQSIAERERVESAHAELNVQTFLAKLMGDAPPSTPSPAVDSDNSDLMPIKQFGFIKAAYSQPNKQLSQPVENSAVVASTTANESLANQKPAARDRKMAMTSHAALRRSQPAALAAAAVPMPFGELVEVKGSGSGFTLPFGKTVTITFQVTLNNPPALTGVPPGVAQVSNQGNVTYTGNATGVLTHDPDPASAGGASAATKDPTLTPVDLFDTTTSVISSNANSSQGEDVTFTATVVSNPLGNPNTITGTVQFLDGATPLTCTEGGVNGIRPLSGGTAACTTNAITPAGSPHTINAQYSGDGNFDPSVGSTSQTVIACVTNPVVTSTADTNTPGTLRHALANVCTAPSNNVTFNLGAGAHTINITSTLVIAKNVNVTNTLGAGNGPVTINAGGGNFRAFRVDSPVTTASLNGLTVTGVNATSSSGGGLFVQNGTVTLTNMLFTGNTVINSAGGGFGVTGGATINVYNTTVSGNTATFGGGIYNGGGTLNLLNVTVTNNTADGNIGGGPIGGAGAVGGGIETGSGVATNIRNSIVANNTATSGANISGTSTDQGNNILTGDPRLAALADNGGLSRTHALLIDSSALDAGDNTAATTAGLTTDQRGAGFARILDSADADTTQTVDIGAFEARASVEDITDKQTDEDTQIVVTFNVGDASTITSVTASSGNTTLVPNVAANIDVTGSGSTRTLTINPALNQNGTSTITVTVTAGTESMQDTFVLTVNPVNDPPSFVKGADQTIDEDAGPQTAAGWATAISPGPNETGQTPFTFNVSVTGTTGSLAFTTPPAIDPTTGDLTYTVTGDTNGTANVSVTLSDSGSNTPPNSNTSAAQTFVITVNPINDPPSFVKGADQSINESAGPQTVTNWATAISEGPNESGQTPLTFNVSVTGTTGNLTFSTPPAIDATTGTLTYAANNGTNGTATVSVTLSDSGSNVLPNSNTSAAQTFTITVGAINDAPVNTAPASVTMPQNTVFTFNGGNLVSVADTDAAEAPSDGVITVSLTATNGIITLSGTAGLTFNSGANGTSAMSFDGTIANINAALSGMTFTPDTNYNGPASIQIVTDDQGKTGTGGIKTDTDTINITIEALAGIYINEVLFNPPGTDAPNEYIELRGTANSAIPAGTYLVAVEGDAADNPGDVQTIIHLSGLSFGSNGFLVLLQNGNTYTTDAGATVVTSTTTGFGGLPGGIWSADSAATDIEDSSVTFMLIQTGVAPTLTDDIDSNDDGLTNGSTFAGWSVRDSISAMNGSANARAYGAFSFRNSAGSGTGLGGEVIVSFIPSYLGRIGDSTGSTAADWVASGVLGGAAPNWTLGTATETEPASFAGKPLNHIGASNFANLAPVNSVPVAVQNVNEDTTLTFNAANSNLISISDPDAGTAAVKVTLTATNGVITLSGFSGLSFTTGDGTADATMTFTGTIADINTALNGLTFAPPLNYNGPASIQILTEDQGNTGVGGNKTDTDTVNITVNPINDPPSFVKGANPTVNEDAGAQTVPGWATSISQGPGETGQTLTFNVTPNGSTGNLSFSSGPAIDAATGNLTFTTSADTNGTATFNITLSDNGSNVAPNSNTSGVQSFTINVTAVNDAPTFQIPSNPPAVNEDAPAQTVNSFATNFQAGPAAATDETGTQTLVGYTVTQTGTTGNLTFTSGPSINNAGQLTYTVTSNTSGTATFNVVATDSGSNTAPNVNQSAPVPFTITVNGQNDAPVLDNTGNMSLNAINEDVANASNNGTLISDIIASAGGDRITDVDAGAVEGIAVIAVNNTNGTWQFTIDNGTNWTPFNTPDGLNARLLASNANTRVRFVPAANFNGTVDPGLTFRAWDQTSGTNGNTADAQTTTGGISAFSTATETASITVNPVNDQPTANAQSPVTNEDTPVGITLTGSDVETASGSLTYTVTVQPTNGVLSGTGANLTYTPNLNYNGPDSFKFTVTDTGDGSSPALISSEATVSITVGAVNDAPVNTIPGAQNVTKNGSLTFNAANSNLISIADVDAGGNTVQVTLTATNGRLTLSGTAGLTFTPANANNDGTNDATLNFTGTIANINAALNGLVFAPTNGYDGPASIQIVTNDQGNTGSGGALSDTDTINITVQKGGVLDFSSATYTVAEDGGSVTITVNRTDGSVGTTKVDYTTSNGTATAGQDYTTSSGQLTFNNGVTTQTFSVPITNDSLDETDETVNLTLSNVSGSGALGVQTTAVLTITDNDPQPSISINDVTQNEGNSGTSNFDFTVTLSAASGLPVTVNYATANGTATAGSDYQAIPTTLLTFNPGETQKTISVVVSGDPDAEIDETFTVNLSGATNATISDNQGLGTILSDDTPVIQFNSATYTVNEDALYVTMTVSRIGDFSKAASINYTTNDQAGLNPCNLFNGIASPRCDYAYSVGKLNFAAGQASRDIIIPIVNDVYVEGSETFTITLSNSTGGDLGVPSSATITILDNDSGVAANPIDNNEFLIRQLYIDFLGRLPDQAGLAAWLGILNNCPVDDVHCDRIEVAHGFAHSEEFASRGYFIYRFYRAALGRVPHYSEFIPDMARVSGFLSAQELEAAKVDFINDFMSRPEFTSRYNGTDATAYVNLLEQTALVTLPNKQQLINDLTAGTKTRAQVLRIAMETAEVYAKYYNEAFIVMNYFGFLRRDPDAAFQAWIDIFNHTNDYRTIINGFINSLEYRQRFGP